MPEDLLPVLIALAALVGFIVAARGYLLYGSIQRAADEVALRRAGLRAAPERMRAATSSLRAGLAESNSELEHVLWQVPRFDEHVDSAIAALRERRVKIESVRVRYLAEGRRGMMAIRRALKLLKQANELRRTFLG